MGPRGALRLSLHITFLVRGLQTFGVAHRRSADPMLGPFGSSWLGWWLSSQGHGAGSGQLPRPENRRWMLGSANDPAGHWWGGTPEARGSAVVATYRVFFQYGGSGHPGTLRNSAIL